MDIKKHYFELIKERIRDAYELQADKIREVAELFGECAENGGVIQLFGVKHGEEFVNELNYRAGGLAPFHALRLRDMMLKKLIDQDDIDSGVIYDDLSLIDKFDEAFIMDDRDMYVLVSYYGNEPVLLEIARRAKKRGQKVVAVVNKKSYDLHDGKLLDYADVYLDMDAEEPDLALDIRGYKVGQISSTVTNVIAQMLTAEFYDYYVRQGKEAPILLSANIKGADVHNNSLTDPYGRRIR
ncbi:MAG: sugar isomerase domain-containing protein [Erysipelotrichaceae bacterium]|nr:sugar isomerase domain-containing protein [Erysipelotrichaceae bacterium]